MRRYTVRAKAGGGQSSHDNKSGKAKSAGAMLRRYGEQALKEDIAQCLTLWNGHIQSCSLILISAPKTMRSILFDDAVNGTGDATGVVLLKEDPRISYVPFMVDRPTLDEAKMVHERCTSVYFNRVDGVDTSGDATTVGAASSEASVASLLGILKPLKPNSSSNEEKRFSATVANTPGLLQCPASQRLISACHGADEEAVLAVLEDMAGQPAFDVFSPRTTTTAVADYPSTATATGTESAAIDNAQGASDSAELSLVVNLVESLETLSTALHMASAQGQARAVVRLLELGASPLATDIRGRMPYFLARDKETRDAFRRFRGTPEWEDR